LLFFLIFCLAYARQKLTMAAMIADFVIPEAVPECVRDILFEVVVILVTTGVVWMFRWPRTPAGAAVAPAKMDYMERPDRPAPPPPATFEALQQDPAALIDTVCDLSKKRHPVAVLDLFRQARVHPVAREIPQATGRHSAEEYYQAVASSAVRLNKIALIPMVFQDMRATGVPRRRSIFEATMRLLGTNKQYAAAVGVYDEMLVDGIPPSEDACSCMIAFLVQSGQLDRALEEFATRGKEFRPSIKAYMQMFKALSQAGDGRNTLILIKDMHTRGVSPDTIVMNVALGAIVASGEARAALELLEATRPSGLLDAISYNTVIKGLIQTGEADRAWALALGMAAHGVPPNKTTWMRFVNTRTLYAKDALARVQQEAGPEPRGG